jgi:predicted unusual protein kinase regulating ubiquinone biosynthesis (AarF/ABC1/UbiB family)
MMLVDNLIHSDLHPGNILVRLEQPHGLVGVAYKAVSAIANPEGMPMRVLGSALQQLGPRKRQPGSSSSSSDGSGVRVVEVVELVDAQSQGADSGDASSSGRSGGKGSRRGVWGFVSQMQGAWSAGGPAAMLQQLQQRLHGVAAGWLQPHIVLLDVGMATELSPEDQTNMVGLFRWVDAYCCSTTWLPRSKANPSCHTPTVP